MGAGIRKRIDVDKLDLNSISFVHKGPHGQITQSKRKGIDLSDFLKALAIVEKDDPIAKVVKKDAEKGKRGLKGFLDGLRIGFIKK